MLDETVGLRVVVAQSFDELEPHFSSWDELAWQAPQGLPTLLPGWVDAFLRHNLNPSERWLCCFAYIENRLVGVLPVVITPHWLLGARWPTLRTPYDVHTPSGDVLLAPDQAMASMKALLEEVRRQVPHHLAFDLRAVRQNSPLLQSVEGGAHGYMLRFGRRSHYSLIDVSGDIDTYWSSLGNMRRNVRRYRKKLDNLGEVSVEVMRGQHALMDLLPEYLALEASGWKGRNGTAIINDPSAIAFYAALIKNFAAQERWEWHLIRIGKRIIAAGMGVRCGMSLILPKIAFDEEFADCMPGNLLTAAVLKDAFSCSQINEVNHLSRADWHNLWRMSQDKYVDVHLIQRAIVSTVLQLPGAVMASWYQRYVSPRVPAALKQFRDRRSYKLKRKNRAHTYS